MRLELMRKTILLLLLTIIVVSIISPISLAYSM